MHEMTAYGVGHITAFLQLGSLNVGSWIGGYNVWLGCFSCIITHVAFGTTVLDVMDTDNKTRGIHRRSQVLKVR